MREYCENNTVFVLAPVQIGIPKRIIYLRNTSSDMSRKALGDYNEDEILINPVILRSEGKTKFLEGCASCKADGKYLVGEVERPYLVEVEYYDIRGNLRREIFEGFKVTVFCHEFDHLNRILHIDRIYKVMIKTLEEMKTFRDEHPYEILSKTGSFENSYKNVL